MSDPLIKFLEELGLNDDIVNNIAKRRAHENKIIVDNIAKHRALEDRIKQEIETTILMDTLHMKGTIENTLEKTSNLYEGILKKFESAQQHSEQGSLHIYKTPKRPRSKIKSPTSTDYLRDERKEIEKIGFPLDMDSLDQSLRSLESLESSLNTGSSLESSLEKSSLESSSGSSSGSILEQSLTSWCYSDSSASECSSIYVDTLMKSINEPSQPRNMVQGVLNGVCIYITKKMEGIKQAMQKMKWLINKKSQNIEGKKIQSVGGGGQLSVDGKKIKLAERGLAGRGRGRGNGRRRGRRGRTLRMRL